MSASAVIDTVTSTLGHTSISDPTSTAGGDAAAPANQAELDKHAAAAAESRRLYIGNLNYVTTEGELKDFFKGYLVESTTIPMNPRTNRAVGYAFVDLSTPSEAERAITELSGKEILERKVSVQLARKPEAKTGATSGESGAEGSGGEGKKRGGTRGGRGGRGRGSTRGGARGGRRRGRRDENGNFEGEESGPTNVPGQVLPLTGTTQEGLAAEPGEPGSTTIDTRPPRTPRQPREKKQRGPPENGIPSTTKVMVANLPYDLSEEKLKELFLPYNPVQAKIALRPIRPFMIRKLEARGEARKGRGFGFVTLESEEMQQKAVNEMNGKDIEGREIAVKVAIDSPGKEDEIPKAEGKENGVEEGVAA
jgi:RNA recognition motif-containing protein